MTKSGWTYFFMGHAYFIFVKDQIYNFDDKLKKTCVFDIWLCCFIEYIYDLMRTFDEN